LPFPPVDPGVSNAFAGRGIARAPIQNLKLSALVGGRFGELLQPLLPHGESDLFLLLSRLDAMPEMPAADVRVPLDLETKAVLLGKPGMLPPVYPMMQAHECGEWEPAADLSASLHLESEEVASYHWLALQWAPEVLAGLYRLVFRRQIREKTDSRGRRGPTKDDSEPGACETCPPVQKLGALGLAQPDRGE